MIIFLSILLLSIIFSIFLSILIFTKRRREDALEAFRASGGSATIPSLSETGHEVATQPCVISTAGNGIYVFPESSHLYHAPGNASANTCYLKRGFFQDAVESDDDVPNKCTPEFVLGPRSSNFDTSMIERVSMESTPSGPRCSVSLKRGRRSDDYGAFEDHLSAQSIRLSKPYEELTAVYNKCQEDTRSEKARQAELVAAYAHLVEREQALLRRRRGEERDKGEEREEGDKEKSGDLDDP